MAVKKVWCDLCQRHHRIGSGAYEKCMTDKRALRRRRLSETSEFPPVVPPNAPAWSEMEEDPFLDDDDFALWGDSPEPGPDVPPAEYITDIVAEMGVEATRGTIEFYDGDSMDVPARDVKGNTYKFSGDGRMSIQGDFARANLEVGDHNLSISDTLIRGGAVLSTGEGDSLVSDSTIMDGTIIESSTVADSEIRGYGMMKDCTVSSSTVAHSGDLNSPITLHRAALHNYSVNGSNITIRDSGFTGGVNDRGRVTNDGVGRIVMSGSVLESHGGGRAPHLSCRGNGELEVRESHITTGTTISSEGSGLFTKVSIGNSTLSYVHVAATGGMQMRNSVFAPGAATGSPVFVAIPEKHNMVISEALVTAPEHIQKWYDNGKDMGWVYRTAPAPGSDTTRATFVGTNGGTTVVDGFDLLLYTGSEAGDGEAKDDSIARMCRAGLQDFIGKADENEIAMLTELRSRAQNNGRWGA